MKIREALARRIAGSETFDKVEERARDGALVEVARATGAKRATVDGIKQHHQVVAEEAKGYEDIGPTETTLMPTRFTDQPTENMEILSGLYELNPWVFVCTNYIATALAGIPLQAMRATGFEDGKETVEAADQSPVGVMVRYINPAQSPYEFTEALTAWLVLTGEAYVAYVTPTPGPNVPPNLPAEMWVLFTPFVKKIISPRNGLIGYEYNVNGEIAYFDAEDVEHFKTWSPAGRWRGQGVPVAGIKTIQTDQELRTFNQNVLKQGVHISGVLETENEDLDREEATNIRQSFNKQYGGAGKAAKVAVLWGGLKFNPTSILQKDVMITEQHAQHRDETIALFGLKPELITEKFANKATAETVRRMAYEDTVLGRWGMRIQSTFNSGKLLKFDPQARLVFDASEVPALQVSLKEKLDAGQVAISSGQMTPNEVRVSIHGLEPLGAELDIPLIGGRPIDQIIAPPEPPQIIAAPGGGGDGNGKPGTAKPKPTGARGGQREREKPEGAKASGLLTTRAMITAAADITSIVSREEAQFKVVFERNRQLAEDRLRRAMLQVYREIAQELRPLVSRSETYSEILFQFEKTFLREGRDAASFKFGEIGRMTVDDIAEKEIARLGLAGSLNVRPVRALKRLANQEQRIRNMWGKDWVKLRGQIGEVLAQGRSESAMAQSVNGFFDGRRTNALTIARTETTPMVNGAAMEVAEAAYKSGTDIVSIWVTNKDEKVRQPPRDSKNHAEAEGLTIIPTQEMFVVSGERMEFPGDSWNGAHADNTINCRCGVRNEIRATRADDNRRRV